MKSLSGEDSAQDEVFDLESARADAAAVVASQGLLVPRGTKGGLTAALLEEQQIDLPRALLTRLVEGKDSWGSVLKLQWEDRLNTVDEEEGCLAGRLACCRADGPWRLASRLACCPVDGPWLACSNGRTASAP